MQQQPQQKVEEKPKAKKSIFSGLFGSSKEAKSEKKDVKMELDNVDSEDDVRSVEDVDSDELDGDLNLSGEEDNSHVEQFRLQSKAKKMVGSKRPARKFRQEIDTNIFKIEFKALKDNAEIVSHHVSSKKQKTCTCHLFTEMGLFFARATATSICHQSSSTITCLVKKIENSSHLRPMQRRELIPGGSRAQCAKR